MGNLNQLIKELSKKGHIIKKAKEIQEEQKIKTGLFALDYILDKGISQCEGGHRIEFFGAESSGKTTVALHIIKKYQELNKTCAFIDAERSYDKHWGEIMGVDNDKLLVALPETLEEAGDLLTELIPKVDLIVIDSIISLIPIGEAERDTAEVQMALSARTNSLITRKLYSAIKGNFTTLIFINQLREKVGGYGNPYTTSGGHALKHFYSTRVEFKLGKPIESGSGDNKERVGYEVVMRCVKNKKGKPHRVASFDFYFNGYIDNIKSLFYSAVKYGIIERKGSYYVYKDIKEQGKDAFINKLKKDDWDKIEAEVWKNIN